MSIVAKMLAVSVTKTETSQSVSLQAVYSSDPASENYSWSQATPGGGASLTITNPAAFDQFEQGKEYLVEFKPAE